MVCGRAGQERTAGLTGTVACCHWGEQTELDLSDVVLVSGVMCLSQAPEGVGIFKAKCCFPACAPLTLPVVSGAHFSPQPVVPTSLRSSWSSSSRVLGGGGNTLCELRLSRPAFCELFLRYSREQSFSHSVPVSPHQYGICRGINDARTR